MKQKYKISTFILIFSFFFGTVQALQSDSEITEFLALMNEELPKILDQNSNLTGLFSGVHVLEDGGPSFINSVYLISLKDGKELILKIGNPIWSGDKTLNEVAALNFLKKNSKIPVPEVLAYESDIDRSPIGEEYIIMPRICGKPLNKEIDRIYENKIIYHTILDQLALYIAELKSFRFSSLGNFTYSKDDKLEIGGIVDFANYKVIDSCKYYSDYAFHALNFYIKEMQLLLDNDSQGSEIYTKYIPILKNLLERTDFSVLNNNHDFVFSHQDCVMKNILVHEDRVVAILDWEWSGSSLLENEFMTGFDFFKTPKIKYTFLKLSKKLDYPIFSIPLHMNVNYFIV